MLWFPFLPNSRVKAKHGIWSTRPKNAYSDKAFLSPWGPGTNPSFQWLVTSLWASVAFPDEMTFLDSWVWQSLSWGNITPSPSLLSQSILPVWLSVPRSPSSYRDTSPSLWIRVYSKPVWCILIWLICKNYISSTFTGSGCTWIWSKCYLTQLSVRLAKKAPLGFSHKML